MPPLHSKQWSEASTSPDLPQNKKVIWWAFVKLNNKNSLTPTYRFKFIQFISELYSHKNQNKNPNIEQLDPNKSILI